jgi:hypothetical protein
LEWGLAFLFGLLELARLFGGLRLGSGSVALDIRLL